MTGQPIAERPRRLSGEKAAAAKKEIEILLHDGILRSSKSPWACPIYLVQKFENARLDFKLEKIYTKVTTEIHQRLTSVRIHSARKKSNAGFYMFDIKYRECGTLTTVCSDKQHQVSSVKDRKVQHFDVNTSIVFGT
ncbi:hypothetical protein PV325_011833 [Microctonus aethiopoides]|nr:hypothetical protein PV325_011833 [Microctonus aethiopoides]